MYKYICSNSERSTTRGTSCKGLAAHVASDNQLKWVKTVILSHNEPVCGYVVFMHAGGDDKLSSLCGHMG